MTYEALPAVPELALLRSPARVTVAEIDDRPLFQALANLLAAATDFGPVRTGMRLQSDVR